MSYCFSRRTGIALSLVLAAALGIPSRAPAQTIISKSLTEMTAASDQIFVGQCVKKEYQVRNGTIITKYTLQPTEMLKGKVDASAQGNIIVEQQGGESPDPRLPLAVAVPGSARLMTGDEVLLFTETQKVTPQIAAMRAKSDAQKIAKGITPERTLDPNANLIFGLNQGFYSIVTNPENGEKLVVHGPSIPVTMASNVENDQMTTASKAKVQSFLAKSIKQGIARQSQPKQLGEVQAGEDQIKSFDTLDNVKAQITQALQKSK